jgi:hypothetical protein
MIKKSFLSTLNRSFCIAFLAPVADMCFSPRRRLFFSFQQRCVLVDILITTRVIHCYSRKRCVLHGTMSCVYHGSMHNVFGVCSFLHLATVRVAV